MFLYGFQYRVSLGSGHFHLMLSAHTFLGDRVSFMFREVGFNLSPVPRLCSFKAATDSERRFGGSRFPPRGWTLVSVLSSHQRYMCWNPGAPDTFGTPGCCGPCCPNWKPIGWKRLANGCELFIGFPPVNTPPAPMPNENWLDAILKIKSWKSNEM